MKYLQLESSVLQVMFLLVSLNFAKTTTDDLLIRIPSLSYIVRMNAVNTSEIIKY